MSSRLSRWLPIRHADEDVGVPGDNEVTSRLSRWLPIRHADETSAFPAAGGFVIHFVGFVKTIWRDLP